MNNQLGIEMNDLQEEEENENEEIIRQIREEEIIRQIREEEIIRMQTEDNIYQQQLEEENHMLSPEENYENRRDVRQSEDGEDNLSDICSLICTIVVFTTILYLFAYIR
jgi:hypothetical protein